MTDKGHREHGDFDLMDGCPDCVADRRRAALAREAGGTSTIPEDADVLPMDEDGPMLVKVQYFSTTTGELSAREYTYYSEDRLAVGDIVSLPVRNTTTRAKVSTIDVSEDEIEAFRDKVKMIRAGSVLGKLEGEDVLVAEVVIGGEYSADEPWLTDHSEWEGLPPTAQDLPSGGLAEAAQKAGAEVTVAEATVNIMGTEETAVALRPGEDTEAHDYYLESVRILELAQLRVIASLEDNKAANNDLAIIAKLKKAMEAKRKEYLEPLKLQSDAIRDTYAELMNPILEAEVITKNKMLAYDTEQRRIRAAQEEINRKRLEAAEQEMKLKGELSESVNLVEVQPEASKNVSTDMGSSGQRDVWKYEILDPDAIPWGYMMPDLVLLGATAKKYHDTKQVAGVRFYCEKIIAVRTR